MSFTLRVMKVTIQGYGISCKVILGQGYVRSYKVMQSKCKIIQHYTVKVMEYLARSCMSVMSGHI